MINSVNEVFNTFTRADYPPGPNNISLVPLENIQSFLFQTFGDNFEYHVTTSGTCTGRQGQENYVTVALTVNTTEGKTTVAGASQGNIGISGLIMGALRNAVLRGLGAGTELYQYEEGAEPNFDGNANGPTTSPVTLPQYQQPGNPYQVSPPQPTYGYPPNGGASANGGYQQPAQNFGPWTGIGRNGQPIVIKSGQLTGQAWINLDPQILKQMADKGNNMAQMELRRRSGMGQPPQQGNQFPPNAFQNN